MEKKITTDSDVDQDMPTASTNLQDIFSRVYKEKLWGTNHQPNDWAHSYYSGRGSHDPNVIAPYIDAVRRFLERLPRPLTMVDLGCGDFFVGSHFADLVDNYIAYDVVDELIEENRRRYATLSVDFRICDLASEPIEGGGVGVLRQVLQHLSNGDIEKVLRNASDFDVLLVTEVIPLGDFEANIDMPSGRYSRTGRGIQSGVVLTEAPFNLQCEKVIEIAKVPFSSGPGHTLTTAYFLK